MVGRSGRPEVESDRVYVAGPHPGGSGATNCDGPLTHPDERTRSGSRARGRDITGRPGARRRADRRVRDLAGRRTFGASIWAPPVVTSPRGIGQFVTVGAGRKDRASGCRWQRWVDHRQLASDSSAGPRLCVGPTRCCRRVLWRGWTTGNRAPSRRSGAIHDSCEWSLLAAASATYRHVGPGRRTPCASHADLGGTSGVGARFVPLVRLRSRQRGNRSVAGQCITSW